MALVVMCGQPCSGKSTAAMCLFNAINVSSQIDDSKPTVRIIDESSLHLSRNQSYENMTMEKNLRGMLRSEVDRSVSKDNIIIVGSLNNIKGYRYELWCIARAAGLRYCVVYCDTEVNIYQEWNHKCKEKGESSYDSKIFGDLARRFEIPDRIKRWDSPLFELHPSRDKIEQTSPVIAEAVAYLTKNVDSRTRDVRVLQPTIATQAEVINAIVEAQSQGLGGSLNKISLGQNLPSINIQRPIRLPEL